MKNLAKKSVAADYMLWVNKIPTAGMLTFTFDGILIDVALAMMALSKAMAAGEISKAEVFQRMTVLQRAALALYDAPLAGPGEPSPVTIDRQGEIQRATSMISTITKRLEMRLDDVHLEVKPLPQRDLDRMRESETMQRRLNDLGEQLQS